MRWIAPALLSFVSASAWAHPLELTTARITLRDAHAEVLVEFDPVSVLSPSLSATALATAPEAAAVALATSARASMEAAASLEADGVAVPLLLRSFPGTGELRALAALASTGVPASGRRAVMVLETTQPLVGVQELRLKLSPSLGPVLYSLVQPESRLTEPGAGASFQVQPPSRPVAAAATPASAVVGIALAALVISGTGVWRLRRTQGRQPCAGP